MKFLQAIGKLAVGVLSTAGKGIKQLVAPSGTPVGSVGPKDISFSFVLSHAVGLAIAILLMILQGFQALGHLIPNPIISGLVSVILTIAITLFHKLGQDITPDVFSLSAPPIGHVPANPEPYMVPIPGIPGGVPFHDNAGPGTPLPRATYNPAP